jgi:hypothetical protein
MSLVFMGAVTAALVADGIAGCGNEPSRPNSAEAAYTALREAADMADRLATASGYPFPTSLANQMHLRDPARSYEPLHSPAQIASGSSIGVYTTASTLWLNKRAAGGLVVQLRRVNRGPARGTYGPTAVTPSGLANGDFVTPIDETWTIHEGRIARIARDANVSATTPTSLRVDGAGRRDRVSTLAYQIVRPLSSRAAGTVYTVDLVARSRKLSRPLWVGTKLDYRDGSYDFFVAAPQSARGAGRGVPQGSSSHWLALESRAVARKSVVRLTIYAVDTGVTALRGTAWIDDVTLTVAKR